MGSLSEFYSIIIMTVVNRPLHRNSKQKRDYAAGCKQKMYPVADAAKHLYSRWKTRENTYVAGGKRGKTCMYFVASDRSRVIKSNHARCYLNSKSTGTRDSSSSRNMLFILCNPLGRNHKSFTNNVCLLIIIGELHKRIQIFINFNVHRFSRGKNPVVTRLLPSESTTQYIEIH